MKKALAFGLAACALLSLAACGHTVQRPVGSSAVSADGVPSLHAPESTAPITASATESTTAAATTAETTAVTTAKPRTGPEPNTSRATPAMSVVTFESRIADQARLNPADRARCRVGRSSPADTRPACPWRSTWRSAWACRRVCAAYSSRARSKTRTFASIASPTARTKPARPGRVSVAPSATRVA